MANAVKMSQKRLAWLKKQLAGAKTDADKKKFAAQIADAEKKIADAEAQRDGALENFARKLQSETKGEADKRKKEMDDIDTRVRQSKESAEWAAQMITKYTGQMN